MAINSHLEAMQEPTKSHLISTTDTTITQEIPRDIKMFGSRVKDQMFKQNMLWCSYHLGNYKSFRSSVSGNGGRDQYIFFYYFIGSLSSPSWNGWGASFMLLQCLHFHIIHCKCSFPCLYLPLEPQLHEFLDYISFSIVVSAMLICSRNSLNVCWLNEYMVRHSRLRSSGEQ